MAKIFQVFYYPEKHHRKKLLTAFPFSVQGVYSYVMQIFYAFLCILFFYSSQSLLSFFPFAHLSFADHRGQTD